MSLINQVLSDLEKRGAVAPSGGAAIRAVSVQQSRRWILPVAGIGVLGLLAAGWWVMQHNTAAPVVPPAPAPVAATPPVAAVPQQAPEPEAPQEDSAGAGKPATRLSFELSSIPLPSSLRDEPVRAAHKADDAKPVLPPEAAISKQMVSSRAETPQSNANKQIKQVSAQQQLENDFRKASTLMQQGRSSEALAGYEAVLKKDAGYEAARQTMVGLLLEAKRNADAERALQEGLAQNPKQTGFAMLLARLQVERNAVPLALETLQITLPYAERQADYQAFVAALLQRQGQHNEAITHYQAAVQLSPNSGVWLMGLGISLQALQRKDEAHDVFNRAIATRTLSAELQAFVERRLKEL